ncbi:hypothetical protein BDV93DRAFT_557525 [Ceratobasidium sp. AG-I]|nr:hypothetical protein BDV93DRAFT_557525 [Ceratobasidium sp. AG-I]
MARKSIANHIDPPNSSPAPVRASQPQLYSPGSTAQGTKRHHALFDTPSEGTQPLELNRANHLQVKSARACNALEYQTQNIPSTAKTTITASQSKPTPTLTSDPHPSLRFDGKDSGNEDKNPRPRKTCNMGTPEHSPPPKPPGCGARVASGGSSGRRHPVTLAPALACELESIIGVNLSTSTAKLVHKQANTLSNPNPPPMGSAGHISETNSHLDPLQNHACDSLEDTSRLSGLQPVDVSEPIATDPIASHFHSPPPLPFFYHPQSPLPALSTQLAVVNSGDTQPTLTGIQPRKPVTWEFQPLPVPQPGSQFQPSQSAPARADNLFHHSQLVTALLA